jgi:MOSC domain-containing protein YiiM
MKMEHPLTLPELKSRAAQAGKITWIGKRPAKRAALEEVPTAELSSEEGLIGDHYSGRSGKRQLTLIQAEHLDAVASMLGRSRLGPEEVRRNVVISGFNLLALKNATFQLGECVLEYTGLCHPCSRMEENLGQGGYNAMRGHGGITARVLKGGKISKGDTLELIEVKAIENS